MYNKTSHTGMLPEGYPLFDATGFPLPVVNRETAPFRCGFFLRLQTFGTLSGGIALLFQVKHLA